MFTSKDIQLLTYENKTEISKYDLIFLKDVKETRYYNLSQRTHFLASLRILSTSGLKVAALRRMELRSLKLCNSMRAHSS